jgi:hypothetical protein
MKIMMTVFSMLDSTCLQKNGEDEGERRRNGERGGEE